MSEAILKARARALARLREEEAGQGARRARLVVFVMAGQRLAIGAEELLSVARLQGVVPVPGAPPEVLGLLGAGGLPYVILSAAALPALGPAARDGGGALAHFALLLRSGVHRVGLAVEQIEGLDEPAAGTGEDSGTDGDGLRLARSGRALRVTASSVLENLEKGNKR